jgi:hypothetical protein
LRYAKESWLTNRLQVPEYNKVAKWLPKSPSLLLPGGGCFLRNEGEKLNNSANLNGQKNNKARHGYQYSSWNEQILGGMGTGEYSIMRHMMNLESVIISREEGTHDISFGMDITRFSI